MKQTLLALFTFLVYQIGYSQSISQTWANPCTGEVNVITVPLTGSTVVTMYNQSISVTYQDVLNGSLTAWVQNVYTTYSSLSPCSQSQAQTTATQQNVQQTAQQATQAAAQAATSVPVSTPTPTPVTAPTTTNQNTTNGTNQNQVNSSSNQNQNQASSSSGDSSGSGTNETNNASGSGGTESSSSSEGTGSTENQGSEDTSSQTNESSQEDNNTTSEGSEDNTSSESDNTESKTSEDSSSEESSDSSSEASENESSGEDETSESEGEGGDSEKSSEDEQEKEEVKEEEKKEEESKEEESVEEEKEEKEEKKKKKKKNTTPPIVVANVSTMEALDRTFSTAITLGYSKSSLRGDKSYGVTSMIWSNLEQYMVMANFSKTFFVKGAPRLVYSTSLMGSRMFSTLSGGNNHSLVYLGKKGLVAGLSIGSSILYLNYEIRDGGVLVDQAILSGNITTFATKPFNFDRYSLSPMLAISSPFINHDLYLKETTYNRDLMIITGVSANYALTRKFYLNLGINATHSTNKEIRSLLNFTIGSRFQF